MNNNIKIIVSNVAEDEKDADGLWDLAADLVWAVTSCCSAGDHNRREQAHKTVYNILRELAIYTHAEHKDNREDGE